MKTDIYLHSTKEDMYDKGQEVGLSEEALDRFIYTAYEVKLTIDIDEETGESTIIAVDDKKVMS